MTYKRTCKNCGQDFFGEVRRGSRKSHCSDECRRAYSHASTLGKYHNRPTHVRVCGYCGDQFKTKVKNKKFCHSRCQKSFAETTSGRMCAFCGAPGLDRGDKKYCDAACRRMDEALYRAKRDAAKARVDAKFRLLACCRTCNRAFFKASYAKDATQCGECKYAPGQEVVRRCVKCHAEFTYKRPRARRLCVTCRDIAQRDHRKTDKARRRARQLGNERENFTSQEIYIRDGWQCYLCGCSVQRYTDPELAGRASDEATLDHIVPVSKGGGHIRANVRTACRACNIAKADQMPTPEFVEAASNA